jgi:hypothetical protein
MTTTYETDFNTATMAAPAAAEATESAHAYYDNPNTYTIAEAWASSPLGELDDEITAGYPATDIIGQPRRGASRAALFALLAGGIIGGASLGAVLFGSVDPGKTTYVVPESGVSSAPLPAAASPTPGTPPVSQKPAGISAPAVKPAAPQAQLAQPVATPNAPDNPATPPVVGPPPVAGPPVVVDISIPPWPPMGGKQDPPPDPDPPKFPQNLDISQIPAVDPSDPSKVQLDPDLIQNKDAKQKVTLQQKLNPDIIDKQ